MTKRIVIVGAGMAGAKLVEELLAYQLDAEIILIGEENSPPYNRIRLSEVIEGQCRDEDIVTHSSSWFEDRAVTFWTQTRVVSLSPKSRTMVIERLGESYCRFETISFDHCVLAMGSSPFMPPIDGLEHPDVISYRHLGDAKEMIRQSRGARRAVVLGGGLLGLEAADALRARGLDVRVLHLMPHLMERQLNPEAGDRLQKRLVDRGIKIHTQTAAQAVLHDEKGIRGIETQDGRVFETDMIVVATGIRPRVQLGIDAGLEVDRAIVVDEWGQTSASNIFAIGECCQFENEIFGLVAPCYGMARACASRLAAAFLHTNTIGKPFRLQDQGTRLKISGIDVFAMGDPRVHDGEDGMTFYDQEEGHYKFLKFRQGRLVAAVLLGTTERVNEYVDLILQGDGLMQHPASLLAPADGDGVLSAVSVMPDDREICGCHGVSKGALVKTLTGHQLRSVGELCQMSKAGTGCGSCKTLVGDVFDFYSKSDGCEFLPKGRAQPPQHQSFAQSSF